MEFREVSYADQWIREITIPLARAMWFYYRTKLN